MVTLVNAGCLQGCHRLVDQGLVPLLKGSDDDEILCCEIIWNRFCFLVKVPSGDGRKDGCHGCVSAFFALNHSYNVADVKVAGIL